MEDNTSLFYYPEMAKKAIDFVWEDREERVGKMAGGYDEKTLTLLCPSWLSLFNK